MKNKNRIFLSRSLGRFKYLSCLKYCEFVIGNSSSGIIEAPSLEIPTINIGNRQTGRDKASSVFDIEADTNSILNTIDYIKTNVINYINPYEKKHTCKNIRNTLEQFDFDEILLKKFEDRQ